MTLKTLRVPVIIDFIRRNMGTRDKRIICNTNSTSEFVHLEKFSQILFNFVVYNCHLFLHLFRYYFEIFFNCKFKIKHDIYGNAKRQK